MSRSLRDHAVSRRDGLRRHLPIHTHLHTPPNRLEDHGDNEELAYEAYFEPPKPISGEWWLVHAVFRYFVTEGFGKSWLTLARTKEINNGFLNPTAQRNNRRRRSMEGSNG